MTISYQHGGDHVRMAAARLAAAATTATAALPPKMSHMQRNERRAALESTKKSKASNANKRTVEPKRWCICPARPLAGLEAGREVTPAALAGPLPRTHLHQGGSSIGGFSSTGGHDRQMQRGASSSKHFEARTFEANAAAGRPPTYEVDTFGGSGPCCSKAGAGRQASMRSCRRAGCIDATRYVRQ